jgi:AcrR family transcriptional regulator
VAVRELIRSGGRSARIQDAVHEAVKRLSLSMSREALTVPQIAIEAGVTPSTIYRRWGDLPALLADIAVERLRPIGEPDDTGAVATDLRAFIEQYAEEMSSPVGQALMRDILVPSGESFPGQCCAFTRCHLETIVARAKARGETAFDIEEVIDTVVAPIVYHILFGDRAMDAGYCRQLLGRLRSFPQAS